MPVPIVRADGVVWRVARDRVLARPVGAEGDGATRELLGAAALVWVALDEPRRAGELAAVLGVDDATVAEAVDALTAVGLLARSDA